MTPPPTPAPPPTPTPPPPPPSLTTLHPVSCFVQAWLAVENVHCLQAPSGHRYWIIVDYLVWVNIRTYVPWRAPRNAPYHLRSSGQILKDDGIVCRVCQSRSVRWRCPKLRRNSEAETLMSAGEEVKNLRRIWNGPPHIIFADKTCRSSPHMPWMPNKNKGRAPA